MILYQLRLPSSLDLDRWVDGISCGVWKRVLRQIQTPIGPYAFVRIRDILQQTLQRHVTTYRSCGLWSYCQAGTVPSPWMARDAFHPDDPGAHWYLLEVQKDLAELVTEATHAIAAWLDRLCIEIVPRQVLEADVDAALRHGIGQYLYENPNCGTEPFCEGAIRYDPWKKRGAT